MTVSIVGADTHPRHVEPLEALFLSVWDRVDALVSPWGAYPPPLFAVDAQGDLLGGLSFTKSDRREEIGPAIWINAVFVRPERRREGIASRLLEHAEALASANGVTTLYAYTDVASLYTKRGWSGGSSPRKSDPTWCRRPSSERGRVPARSLAQANPGICEEWCSAIIHRWPFHR